MPKIFIEQNPLFFNKVKWVLNIISQYTKISYDFISEKGQSNISIGTATEHDIQIDILFFQKLENGQTNWKQILSNGPAYKNKKGEMGILETIFYLVNCVQELNLEKSDIDYWGRFKYTASLQFHYSIIEENFVAGLMDQLIERFPILADGKGKPSNPSQVFLSHDIDLLHSGWKVETYLALKSFDWKKLFRVLKDMVLLKPFYNNIDQVMELDKKYGFKSCFYWLSVFGKDDNGIMNADYTIDDLVNMSKKVEENGFTNGIHKSSFPTTFSVEMSGFPFKVEHNRYHFLKFQTHESWQEIESAGLKTDASLGFAEHIGFRNSYGLPFEPFDMENDKPFSFVEIPLHVMDVTLFNYMELSASDAKIKVEKFILKNTNNCSLSLLWHNNQMTEYSHHENFQTYIDLISQLNHKKSGFRLPNELYHDFS